MRRTTPTTERCDAERPWSRAHLPALDGLRGVAILLVLARHLVGELPADGRVGAAVVTLAGVGWAGVDLFFVLSGFLITRGLLGMRGAPRFYRRFYERRARRIWPLYMGAVAVWSAAAFAWPTSEVGAALRRELPWLWTHTLNWRIAALGWGEAVTAGTSHLWSLAIEEQFYAAWPLVVAVVAPRRLLAVSLAIAVGSAALRTGLALAGAPTIALYVLPVTRLDPIALGAALACVERSPAAYDRLAAGLATLRRPAIAWLGASAALAALVLTRERQLEAAHLIAGAASALAVAATVTSAAPARVLTWAPLRAAGRVSYGLYVFHWPALWACRELRLAPATGSLVAALASIALAWASWTYWERRWLHPTRRAVATTVPHEAAA